jgi:hypothetical protein
MSPGRAADTGSTRQSVKELGKVRLNYDPYGT